MKVITQMESEDGWVPLGEVGKQLANLASDFDPRTFGFRKLSDLVRRTNSFEIDHSKRGLHAHSHKVRCRITSEIEGRHQTSDMRKGRPE
jgi:Fe-S-cluster formation regulator IscX/YfhJ